jgi:hypothetical protein
VEGLGKIVVGPLGRTLPRKPRVETGAKGHNIECYYIAAKHPRACPVLTGWPDSFITQISQNDYTPACPGPLPTGRQAVPTEGGAGKCGIRGF